MTLLLALISAFLPLLNSVIGTSATSLIETALTSFGSLIAAWTANKTDDASAALTALQNVLTALKADTSLDPAVLTQISEAEALTAAAVTAVEGVETGGYTLATYTVPPTVTE